MTSKNMYTHTCANTPSFALATPLVCNSKERIIENTRENLGEKWKIGGNVMGFYLFIVYFIF